MGRVFAGMRRMPLVVAGNCSPAARMRSARLITSAPSVASRGSARTRAMHRVVLQERGFPVVLRRKNRRAPARSVVARAVAQASPPQANQLQASPRVVVRRVARRVAPVAVA